MLHSAASSMLLTVKYTSYSQLLKPLFFLNAKMKSSGNKLREESSQDYKRTSEKKKKKETLRVSQETGYFD